MRWVTRQQLSEETGVPTRTINDILKKEPGVLVTRMQRGKMQYQQPTCAIRLRERVAKRPKSGAEGGSDEDDLETERRKKRAVMEMAEMKAAAMRASLIPHADAIQESERFAAAVRAQLLAAPSRFAGEFPEIPIPEATARLRRIVNEMLSGLQRLAEPETDVDAVDGDEAAA